MELEERAKANREFYQGNIKEIYFPSYQKMNDFVNTICKNNGVIPCAQNAIRSDCVRYFCKFSGFPKKGSFSSKTKCPFFFVTTKTLRGYHISSYDVRHNHPMEPIPNILTETIQEEIMQFHQTGFQPKQIAKILEINGTILSTNYIAMIAYKNKRKQTEDEYFELEKYMLNNNGTCVPLDIFDNDEQLRCAIWTQTLEEKRNLEDFISVILFDSTSTNLDNGWLSIPVSVLDQNRHIKSAGLCFVAFETFQTIEFLLQNIFSSEISRNNQVIITDEDQSYDDPIRNLLHHPFHVLCCVHKIKNFIKLLNSSGLDKPTKEYAKKLFSQVCYSNNVQVVQSSFEELKKIPNIKENIMKIYSEKEHF